MSLTECGILGLSQRKRKVETGLRQGHVHGGLQGWGLYTLDMDMDCPTLQGWGAR